MTDVNEVRDGLHLVTDGLYQALVLDTGSGAAVIDMPPSLGPGLVDAVTDTVRGPVTHLLYSHAHADHVGAASAFARWEPEIVGHALTAAILARRGDPDRPVPTRTFTDTLTLRLGDHEVRLTHHGASHSPDTVVMHLPAQRTLVAVDVVLPGTAPFRRLTGASDVPGLLDAHDRLLDHDVDTVVGGHFRLGDRGDVEAARAYLDDLVATTSGGLRAAQHAAAPDRDDHPYARARAADDRLADEVAPALLERWRHRLAGLEAVVRDHVVTMADSLRWDYNITRGGSPPPRRPSNPPETP